MPASGTITAGEADLARIPHDGWLPQTAWVPQHPHLFATTVAGNIAATARRATLLITRDRDGLDQFDEIAVRREGRVIERIQGGIQARLMQANRD